MNNAKYLRYALFVMVLLGTAKQTLSMDDEALGSCLLFAEYERYKELCLEIQGLSPEDQELELLKSLMRRERRDLRPRPEQEPLEQLLEQDRQEQLRYAQRLEQSRLAQLRVARRLEQLREQLRLEQLREQLRLELEPEALGYKKERCRLELSEVQFQDSLDYRGPWQESRLSEEEQQLGLEHQKKLQKLRDWCKSTDVNTDLCCADQQNY